MPMPYGFYPSPNQMFFVPQMGPQQSWPLQLGPFGPQPAQQSNSASVPLKAVKGPAIGDWFQYCDFHPDHEGKDFSSLVMKFDAKGLETSFSSLVAE